jgi:hypothetical protein
MGIKNAEFNADFESVEKDAKNSCEKVIIERVFPAFGNIVIRL